MKHIGLILPSIPGYSETFIYNKINGLLQSGFRVSLFVGGKKNSNNIPELISIYYHVDINNIFLLFFNLITTFIFHPVRSYRFIYLERVSHLSWICAFKHLIINSHIIGKSLDWIHFGFATTGLGRENVAKAMGNKLAVSFRGFDIGLYPHQHSDCYNLLWEKIDKVHTISDDLYQRALDLGLNPHIPSEKITPAIKTEFFKSNSKKNLHNPLRILTIGRLTWKKGYEYALKALSLLMDKQINFEYHIVGEGNYREAITFAINQLNLTDNVILTGQISHQEVKKQMEWADIYLQPSIQEGFCNAVLEAQSMGLLCIVTDAEGLSENVVNGETGWVVLKRSPEKMVEVIFSILDMSINSLNRIRKNAVNRMREVFDLELQKYKFVEFYS